MNRTGAELKRLSDERDALYRRLDDGMHKIDAARAQSRDVMQWESYWLKLLGRYERTCDRIQELKRDASGDLRTASEKESADNR